MAILTANRKIDSIDVVLHLECEMGTDPTADNAAILSEALDFYGHKARFSIPGGTFVTHGPVAWPLKIGNKITGAGYGRDIGQGHYTEDGLASGQVTQWIFDGDAGDNIIDYQGFGCYVEGIHFQGRHVEGFGVDPADDSAPKARCGIFIKANDDSNHTGKLTIRDCSFYQIHNHVVCGWDMTAANGSGTYTGSNYSHADDIVLENTHHFHPWTTRRHDSGTVTIASGVVTRSGGTAWPAWAATNAMIRLHTTNSSGILEGAYYMVASRDSDTQLTLVDTSLSVAAGRPYRLDQEACSFRVRNDQSIGHYVAKMQNWGYANEVFWFERGGRFIADQIADYVGCATALRISLPQINDNRFIIEGYDMDRVVYTGQLLQMDHAQFAPTYVQIGFGMTNYDAAPATPLATIRGNTRCVLRGNTGGQALFANSIALIGNSTHWAKCHLENAVVDFNDPRDIIHSTGDGLRYLKWTNTSRMHDGTGTYWGIPIIDGDEDFGNTMIDPDA